MNARKTRSIIFYDTAKTVVEVERMKIERTEIAFNRQFRGYVDRK